MTDLSKRLRKAEGSPTLKTVLLGMFDAERTCLEAADALKRMQWKPMDTANPIHGDVVIGYFPKGAVFHVGAMKWHEGDNRWMYEEGDSIWILRPIKWMNFPEGE